MPACATARSASTRPTITSRRATATTAAASVTTSGCRWARSTTRSIRRGTFISPPAAALKPHHQRALIPPRRPGGLNIGLQPSTSDTVELGSKLRLGNGLVSAALFQTETDNELVVAESSGGRTSYANAGKTRRRGLELALDQEFALDWRLNMAWTLLDATYRSDMCGKSGCTPPAIACRASHAIWATPRWPGRRRKAGTPARSCAT